MRCPTCNEKLVVSESDFSVKCPACDEAEAADFQQQQPVAEKTIFDNLFDEPKAAAGEYLPPEKEGNRVEDAGDIENTNFENIDDVKLEPDPVDLTGFDRVPSRPVQDSAPQSKRSSAPAGSTQVPLGSTPSPNQHGKRLQGEGANNEAQDAPGLPQPPGQSRAKPPVPAAPRPGTPLKIKPQTPPPEDVELEDLSTAGLAPTHGLPARHPDEGDVLEPIDVEGLTAESIDVDDLYGIKCKICDTRIHVTEKDVGGTVECPMCYTAINVTPPGKPVGKKSRSKGGAENARRLLGPEQDEDELTLEPLDDEIQLAPPVDVPPVESPPRVEVARVDVDGTDNEAKSAANEVADKVDTGLPPVEHDLLSPLQPPAPVQTEARPHASPDSTRRRGATDGIPELEVLDEPASPAAEQFNPQFPAASADSARGPSRREMFERRKYEQQPGVVHQDPEAPAVELHDDEELGPKDIPELLNRAIAVFRDVGAIWRIVVAGVLLGLSGVFATYLYETIDSEETGLSHAAGLILYALVYFCFAASGSAFLWYVCGTVFRDTALGNVKVTSWSTGGFEQIKSSWLLFSFSFFLVWLPFFWAWLFMSAMIEMLLAPPLLLGAWFNQSPFNVFAPDAFRNFARESSEWTNFYIVVLIFATLTGAGCAMMRMELLNPVFSMVGGMIQAFMTVAFAAVVGGHVGRVVARLKQG